MLAYLETGSHEASAHWLGIASPVRLHEGLRLSTGRPGPLSGPVYLTQGLGQSHSVDNIRDQLSEMHILGDVISNPAMGARSARGHIPQYCHIWLYTVPCNVL